MATKYAILNDTHWGVRGNNLNFLDYIVDFHNSFFLYLKKHNIKNIIHLGDVFDNRKSTNVMVMNKFNEIFIDQAHQQNINIDFIVGNHDVVYRNTNDINSLNYLEYIEGVDVYTEPKILDNNILLVPWIPTDREAEFIDVIEKSTCDYCFGHFDIIGFNMGTIENRNHGQSKKIFKNFKRVLSGHYHNKQKHGSIEYLGSQYEMTWGDHDGTKRGFHIFDSSNGELDFVENKVSIFKTLHLNDKSRKIAKSVNFDNKIVKIIYSGTNHEKLILFVDDITNRGAIQVIPVNNNELFSKSIEGVNEEIDENTVSLISNIIDDNEDLNGDVKEELKGVFHDLYKEALNNENYI